MTVGYCSGPTSYIGRFLSISSGHSIGASKGEYIACSGHADAPARHRTSPRGRRPDIAASLGKSCSKTLRARALGTGGKCALYVDGQKVSEGHIPKTQPYAFSGDEGADVGMDAETAVSNDYKQGDNRFTGKIVKVTVDTNPSGLSKEDQATVDEVDEAAAAAED